MKRKVLITGASRGIGRAIAEEFAKEGDDLFLTCKNNIEDLKDLAMSLEKEFGITAKAIKCDGGDFGDVNALFDEIEISIPSAIISEHEANKFS